MTYDDAGKPIPPSERFNPERYDVRFILDKGLDPDADGYYAGRMSLDEMIAKGMAELARKNRDNVAHRIEAMRSIGENLASLRRAMAL